VTRDREERFRALFEGERGHLTAYALRRTRSHENAADIVAETFLIAWERLEAVPPGDGSRLWLYATARNVLANERRRMQRRSEITDRIASDLRRAHSLGESPGESRLEAIRVLSDLPEEDSEILMLAGWEGLSSRELGTVLGCSAVAARIRLHRARTRMVQAFSGSPDEVKQPAQSRHVPGESVSE
jgi:RNA polymerase sigma factor (sigma-70 family)